MAVKYVPSAYATIQAALNACSSDDEIRIASGTYTEHDIKWPGSRPARVTIGP